MDAFYNSRGFSGGFIQTVSTMTHTHKHTFTRHGFLSNLPSQLILYRKKRNIELVSLDSGLGEVS